MGISIYIRFYNNFRPKIKGKKNTFSRVEINSLENLYLTAKLYKIQYLNLFPFNCNTSTQLFWIESIIFLRVSDGISFQYCLMQDFKVSLFSN